MPFPGWGGQKLFRNAPVGDRSFDAKFTSEDEDFNPNIRYDLQDQEVMEYMIQIGLAGAKRLLNKKPLPNPKRLNRRLRNTA